MIIGRILDIKFAFKWASHVDFSLHLSERDGNWRIVHILVLLQYFCENLSNTIGCPHCLLMMEMAYTTLQSLTT